MSEKAIPLLYLAWGDLDRVVGGLSDEDATRCDGGSSIAWTIGHLAQQMDRWLLGRFQGLRPHPLIGQATFSTGASGDWSVWPAVVTGLAEVRTAARRFLDADPTPSLDLTVPYDGHMKTLHGTGLPLRFALLTIVIHHYEHIGEIGTIRSRWGHTLPVYPSNWGSALL